VRAGRVTCWRRRGGRCRRAGGCRRGRRGPRPGARRGRRAPPPSGRCPALPSSRPGSGRVESRRGRGRSDRRWELRVEQSRGSGSAGRRRNCIIYTAEYSFSRFIYFFPDEMKPWTGELGSGPGRFRHALATTAPPRTKYVNRDGTRSNVFPRTYLPSYSQNQTRLRLIGL
jgi:hypothetical protein